MKIICDCGNQADFKLKEDGERYEIDKVYKWDTENFDFCHLYNQDAAIICKKCGRKLNWY